jgi:hypothetical protein
MTSSLKVPNNSAGNGFISDLRKILKGVARVQRYGRLSDRKHLYPSTVGRNERQIYFDRRRVQRNLPIRFSSHYAVYISPIDTKDGARVWGMVEAIKKIYNNHNQTVTL